ncbi:hypothetical protein H4Q26_009604 [Puccinia striiformis f. sp. tritici PST-130]|nr:hypothetical protein H4Q26_009604 [Puccinia striiformis f. sp. tritici PST-130]
MKEILSTITTSLFNATILFNSTHAVFNVNFGLPHDEIGWFSIGHGTTMSNSRMMIMWPLKQNDGNVQWMKAYCKASGHALPTTILSPHIDSVRIEGSQANQMTYTRPLMLSDVDTFQRDVDQRVVWAMSSVLPNIDDGSLGSSAVGVNEHVHSKRHDTLITLHATFLAISWGMIAPLALSWHVSSVRKGPQMDPGPLDPSTHQLDLYLHRHPLRGFCSRLRFSP